MNKYGAQAMRHWKQWCPNRYSQIPNPTEFFSTLGEQVQDEIGQMEMAIAGDDKPGETFLEKVGRLNMARMQAEEMILPENVLIPPEDQEDEEEDEDLPPDSFHAIMRQAHRDEMQEYQDELDAEFPTPSPQPHKTT